MAQMATLNPGKVMEITAQFIARKAGGVDCGTSRSASILSAYAGEAGVEFRPTDEETAKFRKTQIFTPDGQRVNPGRGEMMFDAHMPAGGFLVPVSLKGGDSRDLTTAVSLVRAWVDAGLPIWVYCLSGEAEKFKGKAGIMKYATGLTMRRIDATPVIRDFLASWEISPEASTVRVRANKVGKYLYPRLNINWKKVPASYWLDAEPIPFDPTLPLPRPW